MISQGYDLNMIPNGMLVRVPVSQYDAAGSRTLLFNLYYGPDGSGVSFSIPSGASVFLDGTKPGGKSFRYTMTIVSGSTNQVSVDIDEQMTAVKGEVLCQVTIEKNDEILGSANFILDVEEAALQEGSDMSESIIAHIIKLVEEAGAAAALAKRSAEEAEQHLADLGTLSSLTTDAKTNLVDAINEVDSHADSNTTYINQIQDSTEYFSKETEQRLADLDSKFTSYLPADTNIDNWDTTGFWVYQREAPYSHTGTYPISDQYGTLICVRGTSENFAMQMIRSNSTSRTEGTLYIRYRTAGTWGSWLTYEDNSNLNRIAGFTLLASGTNVNSLTTTGIYLVGDPSAISNLPSGMNYGQLYVYTTSVYTRQIFFDFASNTPFERWTTDGGSNWSAWVSNIATLNSKLTWQSVTLTAGSGVTINTQAAYKIGNLLFVFASITLSSNVSPYATLLIHGLNARCGWIAPLYTNYKTPISPDYGVYGDAGNTTIRASTSIAVGTYQVSCVIPFY